MIFLNIRVPDLENEAFIHASNEQVGLWLRLAGYCARQENGGRIKNCRNWAAGSWARITGSDTPSDLCPLWKWTTNDLLILFYPKNQETAAINKRALGKFFAQKRWRATYEENGSPIGSPNA